MLCEPIHIVTLLYNVIFDQINIHLPHYNLSSIIHYTYPLYISSLHNQWCSLFLTAHQTSMCWYWHLIVIYIVNYVYYYTMMDRQITKRHAGHWQTYRSLKDMQVIDRHTGHWKTCRSLTDIQVTDRHASHWNTGHWKTYRSLKDMQFINRHTGHWNTYRSLKHMSVKDMQVTERQRFPIDTTYIKHRGKNVYN